MARAARALRVVDSDYGADPGEVKDFAEGLPERFLYCREMGHNWKPFSAGRRRSKDGGGFVRVLRCTRCRCKRYQNIDMRGMIESSHYEHPDGYLLKGLGHIVGEGRGVLRLVSMERIVTSFGEED